MIAFKEASFWMNCPSLYSCVFYGLYYAFQVNHDTKLYRTWCCFPSWSLHMQDRGTSALTAVRIPNSSAQTYLTQEVPFVCRGKKWMLQVKDCTQDSKDFFV